MDKERSELLRKMKADPENEEIVHRYETLMKRLGYIKIYIECFDQIIPDSYLETNSQSFLHDLLVSLLRNHLSRLMIAKSSLGS
jgi:hypothetical protein